MYEYDDDELRKLFGFQLPEEQQAYQAQEPPQLAQGLLGDTSSQNDFLKDLNTSSSDTAAQMAQVGQQMANQGGGSGNSIAQRQAQGAQLGQQALAQQQQQQQQSLAMLMKLASMFMGGGA